MISIAGPPARRERAAHSRLRIDSNRCSTLTPQPTPIESPTRAMRNVPAGFSIA